MSKRYSKAAKHATIGRMKELAYFAFGSNMSRARLEARVGKVNDLGHAILEDYRHSFSHCGEDGSAKGNVEICEGTRVHGVAYELTAHQQILLHPYERGYSVVELQVVLQTSLVVEIPVYCYVSHTRDDSLSPLQEYLLHYSRGMREHNFPQAYIDAIEAELP